ncbi:hypothetical protein [Burkholderia gladioli]|uniref:hypothetical protein n=1 Tax=Burkholderia gladioli TaxID=28095 RepID=UPI0013DDC097|nr:hypothetical protein [Burkholderia gladioli]
MPIASWLACALPSPAVSLMLSTPLMPRAALVAITAVPDTSGTACARACGNAAANSAQTSMARASKTIRMTK